MLQRSPGPKKLAELIKSGQEELGMTQAQLAKKIGYKYGNFISMIESGGAGKKMGTLLTK